MGTHGVIDIHLSFESSARAIISYNNFIRNSGLIKSSVIHLMASFDKYLIEGSQNFCSAFNIISNYFSHNLILPLDNSLIALECREFG